MAVAARRAVVQSQQIFSADWKSSAQWIQATPDMPHQSDKREPVVGYLHSANLPALLEAERISLIVSTYQAQRILLFTPSSAPGKLNMLMRLFERPTGIAFHDRRLALCARNQLWIFEDAGTVRSADGTALPYDLVLKPHRSFVTGDLLAHEVALVGAGVVFVNTRFSCLATVDSRYSFRSVWQPPFISELVAEDRCHLNGMACDQSGPRFVTALGATNTAEGWRADRQSGGVMIDLPTGEIICRGLAMPHSPRIYGNRLWLLESGRGELQVVEPDSGKRTTVAALPGYLRGLAFHKNLAFIGTSLIREKHHFGDMPIESKSAQLKCGIQVVDIARGEPVGFIEFTKGIEELFDIAVIPGAAAPHVLGFEEPTIDGLFVLP